MKYLPWDSWGVALKGSNDPNENETKQCKQQIKEVHYYVTLPAYLFYLDTSLNLARG